MFCDCKNSDIDEIAQTDEKAEMIKMTDIAKMAHMNQMTQKGTKTTDIAKRIKFKEMGETTAKHSYGCHHSNELCPIHLGCL